MEQGREGQGPGAFDRPAVALWQARAMPRAIKASGTISIASTRSRQSGKVMEPGSIPPATASAIVSRSSISTRRPAASDAAMKAEVSGSTPTTLTPGRTALR